MPARPVSTRRLHPALSARVGGLPRTFWLLWGGTLVNRLGTFVEPFLILYLTTQRGLSLGSAGLVVGLYGVGSIGGPVLGGSLADRVGRRATMVGALLASALLLGALGAARAPWLLTLCAFLLGVAGDSYRPAAQAAVADVVAFADRRRASGLIFWAVNLGFSAAAVAGGALAASGYTWLFVLDALTCVAYAVVVGRFVGETRPELAEHEREQDAGGWASIARDRTIVAQLLVMFAGAIALTQLFTILPLSMAADGHGPAAFGAVLAVNGVTIVLLHPLLSTVVLRHDPGRVLALAGVVLTAGLLLVAAASGLWLYVVALVVMTLGEILTSAIGPGLMQELAPPRLRGRYAGAYGLCFAAAFAVVPVVGTQLLGDGGSSLPWVLAAVLTLASAAAQLALTPAIRRRRAAAEAAEDDHALDAAAVASDPAVREPVPPVVA